VEWVVQDGLDCAGKGFSTKSFEAADVDSFESARFMVHHLVLCKVKTEAMSSLVLDSWTEDPHPGSHCICIYSVVP
jgi:hypothetical protein